MCVCFFSKRYLKFGHFKSEVFHFEIKRSNVEFVLVVVNVLHARLCCYGARQLLPYVCVVAFVRVASFVVGESEQRETTTSRAVFFCWRTRACLAARCWLRAPRPSALLTARRREHARACLVAERRAFVNFFVRIALTHSNSLRALAFSRFAKQMARPTRDLHNKSSRIIIDHKKLTASVIAIFVALAFVNSIALNVIVAFQQGQAFSSTRCLMNEFSSSILTVR